MKTRNELIEYFMDNLEFEKNNIVDELKEEYKKNEFLYHFAEIVIRKLASFEEFNIYDTAMADFVTILLCNEFILGYEQCKKDILNHINETTKKR